MSYLFMHPATLMSGTAFARQDGGSSLSITVDITSPSTGGLFPGTLEREKYRGILSITVTSKATGAIVSRQRVENLPAVIEGVKPGIYLVVIDLIERSFGTVFYTDIQDNVQITAARREIKVSVPVKAYAGALYSHLSDYTKSTVNRLVNTPEFRRRRSYLGKGEQQKDGYAVYGFILLGKRPKRGTELYTRYVSAIDSWIDMISVSFDQSLPDRKGTLIVYMPVTTKASETWRSIDDSGIGNKAESILELYDWDRSLQLLAPFRRIQTDGPIFVAARRPLTEDGPPPGEYVFIDLKNVDSRIVSAWMAVFLYEATNTDFGKTASFQRFALQLRNSLAEAATGLDKTSQSLTWWKSELTKLITISPRQDAPK